MRSIPLFRVSALLVFLLAGCSDGSAPTAVLDEAPGLAASRSILGGDLTALSGGAAKGNHVADARSGAGKGGRWVHNVTGGGKDLFPTDTDASFTLAVNARADENGDAAGQMTWWFLDGTPASYGDVYCVEVRGNRAYVGYLAEGGDAQFYGVPGNSVLVGFEDNGEGAGSPGDRQTYIYFVEGRAYDCAAFADQIEAFSPANQFPVAWVRGNVQVR